MRGNWGKNTAGRCHRPWVMLRPIGFLVLKFVFQVDPLFIYIYIYMTAHLGLLNSELRETRPAPDLRPCDIN
jgi:hypothetical protein